MTGPPASRRDTHDRAAADPARGAEVVRPRPRARLPLLVGAGALEPAADRRRPRARYFWDYDGNRYLDFSSQLVNTNIGHQHPKVVAAIAEQAARLATIAPQHANDARGRGGPADRRAGARRA